MNISLENLVIILIFILPGFIATYIRLAHLPRFPRKVSAFQEILGSITTTIPIVIVQLSVLAILLRFCDSFREDLSFVFESGLKTYISTYTLRAILVFLVWGTFILCLSIAFAYLDPLERFVKGIRKKTGEFYGDIWHNLFLSAPREHDRTHSYLRVWLKTSECYGGWLQTFEPAHDGDKTRLFWLIAAKRWRTHNDAITGDPGEDIHAVLLNYNNVCSIDVWWGYGPEQTTPD